MLPPRWGIARLTISPNDAHLTGAAAERPAGDDATWGSRMRRLDWFLAAVVAAFLASALIAEAHMTLARFSLGPQPTLNVGDVTVRRLVGQLPHAPILPGEAQ